MMELCLILTASFKPAVTVPFLTVRSAYDRTNDYISSLRYWSGFGYKVVLIDNTHSIPQEILDTYATRQNVEILQFQGISSSKGKGNGEIEILQYAFGASTFLRSSTHILKITGRLILYNGKSMLEGCKHLEGVDISAEFRDGLRSMPSQFVFGSRNFFTNYLLNDSLAEIEERNGYYFEHLLARATHLAMANGLKWCPPPVPFIIKGVSGSSGKHYSTSLIRRMVTYVAHLVRREMINRP